MEVDLMMLCLLLLFAMFICACSPCDGFRSDKACQIPALRGKEQWEANKKRYKCKGMLKHKTLYYIARDECWSILDNRSDEESKEETGPYQMVPIRQLDNTPTGNLCLGTATNNSG
jgi:hypothetical protein